MKKRLILTLTFVFVASMLAMPFLGAEAQDDGERDEREFHIRGTSVQTIGEYPDSFNYDGTNVIEQEWGFFELHVDSGSDTGVMFSRFHVSEFQVDADTLVEDAEITVIYPLFGAPTDTMPAYWQGGIAVDADLHGDSGAEAPVLPTVFNEVASWGPVAVWINGEIYEADETFMGEENVFNLMTGHMMYSELVRDAETGEVFQADGETYFVPSTPGDGSVVDEEVQLLHLVAHTDTRDTEAFPPFTMFLHVNFYDVEEIEPIEIDYMTWEDYAELDQETWDEWVAQWIELIDEREAELFGDDMEDMDDSDEMSDDTDSDEAE